MPRKLDRDRSHGDKLMRLHWLLLFSSRRHSLTELARELGCSKQTVARLVDTIGAGCGAPIAEEIERGRKYYRMERVRLPGPPLPVSLEELRVLQMCRVFARHLLGEREFEAALRAVDKSAQLLARPGPEGPPPEAPFASLRPGTIDYTPHQQHLRTILEAMDELKVCEAHYRRIGDDEDRVFRMKPLKVFSHRDSVYVHARYARLPGRPFKQAGYDPVFALHRFRSVVKTGTPFRPPQRYDFERAFNREFGVVRGRRFRVAAEFEGWAAGFVAERTWSVDQQVAQLGDGRIRLEFTATSEPEVLAWILAFDHEAKLLGPKDLVGKLKERLERVAELYSAVPSGRRASSRPLRASS